MIRNYLLIPSGMLLACVSLFGQSTSPEAGSIAKSAEGDGRYESGFEVFNPGKDPEALGFYAMTTLEKIRNKWYLQIPALQKSTGRKSGITIIEFEIGRDGSVRKMTKFEAASDPSLDRAATGAISSAAPFEPLPQAYHEKALRLSLHFGYDQPGSGEAPFCDGPDWGAQPAAYVLHRVGGGVTAPKNTYDIQPEYSERARQNKYQSSVQISGTVDPKGTFTDLCVSKAAGEGLDEKAIDAVKTWKFEPATLRGEPVAVRINVEVSFRLY